MTVGRLQGLDAAVAQQVVATAQALELGRVTQAAAQLVPALSAYPNHPEVLRLHAGILNLQNDFSAALTTMQRAIDLRPTDALYLNTLATILTEADRFDEAIMALRRATSLQPNMALTWYNLGIVLIRCVRYDEALPALRRAVAIAPDHVQARAQLADLLRVGNHPDEAIVEYRNILRIAPWTGMAWWGLANIKTVNLQPADIVDMQIALKNPRGTADDRVAIGFALARALDDQGAFRESMEALRCANEIATAMMRERNKLWNRGAFRRTSNLLLAEVPESRSADRGHEIIFIVGLPRSGTTLVEQVLASHPEVEGAGELPDLPLALAEDLQKRGGSLAQWLHETTVHERQRIGEQYLRRTSRWRQGKHICTDKLPGNWMYIGAIRAILPDARIICCRRDPLETCFSCYRHLLQGNEYSRSFNDLADFWRDYDHAVKYWQNAHPTHVYEHVYENLISDPETSIRSLLDFCGLRFDQACLEFYRNRRDVRSPSAMQVRQPLRNDTARARQYGSLLDPLREALGLPAFAN